MQMNETLFKAYLAEAIKQELGKDELDEGLLRTLGGAAWNGTKYLWNKLFKKAGEEGAKDAGEGILRKGFRYMGGNKKAMENMAENLATLQNKQKSLNTELRTLLNKKNASFKDIDEEIEAIAELNSNFAKTKGWTSPEADGTYRQLKKLQDLKTEYEETTKKIKKLEKQMRNSKTKTRAAQIGGGTIGLGGIGLAGANALYDKISQNNAYKDAASPRNTGTSTTSPVSGPQQPTTRQVSDDELTNLLKEDKFSRNIRRAKSSKQTKLNRAKQYFLQTWGYTWDDSKTYEENIANVNRVRTAFNERGFKNYDDYLMKTPGAVDKRKQTVPQENNTPQTPEQPVRKYDPSQPAPFYNNRQKVMQFQTWFNDFNEKNGYGAEKPLVVDGIWGQYTQDAWQRWLKKEGKEATAAPTT